MSSRKAGEYLPIENYGIIGNLHTTALVAIDGSIDFMSFPQFDSPTIFCRLLDSGKGGFFSVSPVMKNMVHRQMYMPDTNVLLTRFFADEGIAELIDFMPVPGDVECCVVIRRITAIRGKMKIRVVCAPRFNYARTGYEVEKFDGGLKFIPEDEVQPSLVFSGSEKLVVKSGDVYAEFELSEGQSAYFVLETENNFQQREKDLEAYIRSCYQTTVNYWKKWISKTKYNGQWQEEVRRSALVLKLLMCEKHGSMVAAPTFSLPEAIGSERNWDYRYTWIRDAAFAMHAFLQLGFTHEARKFLDWTMHNSAEQELQLMFGIDGTKDIRETVLDHLEGYKGSKPVRIGNDAYRQTQMDIYGELLETVYLYIMHGGELTFEHWQTIQRYVECVINDWNKPDHSIWEVRGLKREFLFSRMMCWVAIDRAIKIAGHFSYPFDMLRWHKVRDEIYYDIYENFWNEKLQAFVQYKGGEELDASALLMPILRIISPSSPRWKKTMEAIDKELRSDVMVFRYRDREVDVDGLHGSEGSFTMCSFWHVECLSLMGKTEQAKEHFEKMLGYANHLGLFAEEIGMKGEHLGNFPQAFTHLALISAAVQVNHNDNGGNRLMEPYY